MEAGAADGEEGEDTAKFEPTIAEMELFKQRLGIKSTLPVMGRPVTPSAGQNGEERGKAKCGSGLGMREDCCCSRQSR